MQGIHFASSRKDARCRFVFEGTMCYRLLQMTAHHSVHFRLVRGPWLEAFIRILRVDMDAYGEKYPDVRNRQSGLEACKVQRRGSIGRKRTSKVHNAADAAEKLARIGSTITHLVLGGHGLPGGLVLGADQVRVHTDALDGLLWTVRRRSQVPDCQKHDS